MVNDNYQVLVQEPNKPKTRERVGYLSVGAKPTADDYARWGLDRQFILSEKPCRVGGEKVFLIVALKGN